LKYSLIGHSHSARAYFTEVAASPNVNPKKIKLYHLRSWSKQASSFAALSDIGQYNPSLAPSPTKSALAPRQTALVTVPVLPSRVPRAPESGSGSGQGQGQGQVRVRVRARVRVGVRAPVCRVRSSLYQSCSTWFGPTVARAASARMPARTM